jgi:hypothetical protein
VAEENTSIAVKLMGDPVSYFYNLGTPEKEDWRKGGDVLNLCSEQAARFVESGMAQYVDEQLNATSATSELDKILQGDNVTFDQTPSPEPPEQDASQAADDLKEDE